MTDAKKIRRTKKQKVTRNPKQVDPQLALSIENLQKIQDDLAEVLFFLIYSFN